MNNNNNMEQKPNKEGGGINEEGSFKKEKCF